jgi:multiple sugar transport system permease protein
MLRVGAPAARRGMTGWSSSLAARENRIAWLLLAPMLIIVLGITAYPFLETIWISFQDRSLTGAAQAANWVGLNHYRNAIGNSNFLRALGRTLYFTVISVSIEVVLGVAVALLLDREFVGRRFVRALLVLPLAMPTIVSAMMWRLIYNPEYGSLNAALTALGLIGDYRSWLGEPGIAMNMVIVAEVWKNFSIVSIIVLAALQLIPSDLYEAALIDGAGPLKRFIYVTLPGILGPLCVAVVLRTIEAFKVFDIFYVMTRGGPADSTKTATFFVYEESFAYLRAGSGASYALIVVAISMVLIVAYLRLIHRQGNI